MPYKNTYYSQDLYDQLSEEAKKLFGEDSKRMDKLIKACLQYGLEHLDKLQEWLKSKDVEA